VVEYNYEDCMDEHIMKMHTDGHWHERWKLVLMSKLRQPEFYFGKVDSSRIAELVSIDSILLLLFKRRNIEKEYEICINILVKKLCCKGYGLSLCDTQIGKVCGRRSFAIGHTWIWK